MARYQICQRCIMDSTDPEITFDENGFCNHCSGAIEKIQKFRAGFSSGNRADHWERLVKKMKEDGAGKEYDCIIGVSGGVDSTYVAYLVHQSGLRPLAVHLDNGWDSEIAVKNIENVCNRLNIDLFTKVLDWEEFRDLQISFLKSSTPDSEIPTDHAIYSVLYQKANELGIKYIISGSNIETESILPQLWSYGHYDWKYIKNIQKKFGTKKLKDFPHMTILKLAIYYAVKKIQWISVLNYFNYNKAEVKAIISSELGWADYGEKHGESLYTKFYQSYLLPAKFDIDKRKAHFSSLIVSGQMSREVALNNIKLPLYREQELKNEIDYFKKKFDLTDEDFYGILNAPPKYYYNYKSNFKLLQLLQNYKSKVSSIIKSKA